MRKCLRCGTEMKENCAIKVDVYKRQPLHSYWMTKNCPMKNAANILPLCRLLLKS